MGEKISISSKPHILIVKHIIVGNNGVGKTSIVKKLLKSGKGFNQNYRNTIGAEFSIKKTNFSDKRVANQFWIMESGHRFEEKREAYYLGSQSYTIVFDVTNRDSFHTIPDFADELMRSMPEGSSTTSRIIPLMLIGNKIDLRDRVQNSVSHEEGKTYVKELSNWWRQDVPYVETSVTKHIGHDKLAEFYFSNKFFY